MIKEKLVFELFFDILSNQKSWFDHAQYEQQISYLAKGTFWKTLVSMLMGIKFRLDCLSNFAFIEKVKYTDP